MSTIILGTTFFIHYIADFIVQTRWQAENKSSNLWALTKHVLTYTLCFLPLLPFVDIVPFMAFTGLAHWLTDYCTSRASTAAYKAANMRRFWAIIGGDQLIHIYCLMVAIVLYAKA
jgi:hypothetical protein